LTVLGYLRPMQIGIPELATLKVSKFFSLKSIP